MLQTDSPPTYTNGSADTPPSTRSRRRGGVRRAPALGLLFVLWLGETLLAAVVIFMMVEHQNELLDPLHVAMRALYRGDGSGNFILLPVTALTVGGLQALVLRGVWPGFPIRQWLGAWVVGIIPAYVGGEFALRLLRPDQYLYGYPGPLTLGNIVLALLSAALAGTVIGLLIAWPQQAVLRAYVPHAGWWFVAHALAWTASGLALMALGIVAYYVNSNVRPVLLGDEVPWKQINNIRLLLTIIIPALLLGVITGGTLLALLVQRPTADKTH